MRPICAVDECTGDAIARGLCKIHYSRFKRAGTLPPLSPPVPRFDRFWSKVEFAGSDECWNWTASVTRGGYGRFRLPDRHVSAHRFSYELTKGEIPAGLDIDHLCRNRRCVNPSHLEAVTERENAIRGISIVAENSRKTHCKWGHELVGDNLIPSRKPWRVCRECARRASREHGQRIGNERRREMRRTKKESA